MAPALAMAQGIRCEFAGFRGDWLPTGDEPSLCRLASRAASISRGAHAGPSFSERAREVLDSITRAYPGRFEQGFCAQRGSHFLQHGMARSVCAGGAHWRS